MAFRGLDHNTEKIYHTEKIYSRPWLLSIHKNTLTNTLLYNIQCIYRQLIFDEVIEYNIFNLLKFNLLLKRFYKFGTKRSNKKTI